MIKKQLVTLIVAFSLILLAPTVASDEEQGVQEPQTTSWIVPQCSDSQAQENFSLLPTDTRIQLFNFLDHKSVVSLSSTCRLLRNDYREALARAQAVLNTNKQTDVSALSFGLYMHPSLCVAYVERALMAWWRPDECYDLSEMQLAQELGCNAQELVKCLESNTVLSKLVVKHSLSLDLVIDYRYLELVGCMVDEVSELAEVVTSESQELSDQEELVSKLKSNAAALRSNLNAAFILSWGKDPDVDAIEYLRDFQTELKECIFKDDFVDYLTEHPEQPVWACYALDGDALVGFCHVVRQINYSGNFQKSLRNMGALKEYVRNKYPKLQLEWLISACSDCIYQSYAGNLDAAITAEAELLRGVTAIDAEQIILASEASLANVIKMDKILSKSPEVVSIYNAVLGLLSNFIPEEGIQKPKNLENRNDVALLHLIYEQLAIHVLLMADNTRFHIVQDFLAYVNATILRDGEEISLGATETRTYSEEQSKYAIGLALALYKKDYKSALESLKHVTYCNPFLMVAMNHAANDTSMDDELATALGRLIADTLEKFSKEDAEVGQNFLDDKGRRSLIRSIFDQGFCSRYLVHQSQAQSRVNEALAEK